MLRVDFLHLAQANLQVLRLDQTHLGPAVLHLQS